jgi:hypothetical protein
MSEILYAEFFPFRVKLIRWRPRAACPARYKIERSSRADKIFARAATVGLDLNLVFSYIKNNFTGLRYQLKKGGNSNGRNDTAHRRA